MMKRTKIIFPLFFYFSLPILGRNVYRPINPTTPCVSVSWIDSPSAKKIHSTYFTPFPLFSFKKESIAPFRLPKIISLSDGTVAYRATIDQQIEYLLNEIRAGSRKRFRYFTLLQKKNFNFKHQCGLLVFSFKEYPLVLKLFIETPQTFFNKYTKGIETTCFFYMAGGTNRHLTGLTRIPNREKVLSLTKNDPFWKDHVVIPQKWFWVSPRQKNILITSDNMIANTALKTEVPSIYGIIAERADTKSTCNLFSSSEQNRLIFRLTNTLHNRIDAHRDNFIFSLDPVSGWKVTIIDTEYFPALVGIEQKKQFSTYTHWYAHLIRHCFARCYLTDKESFNRGRVRQYYTAGVEAS